MAKELLHRIGCPYTDCSKILVHEEAVSRLLGLNGGDKGWLHDEVNYIIMHCEALHAVLSHTGCQRHFVKDVQFSKGWQTLCKLVFTLLATDKVNYYMPFYTHSARMHTCSAHFFMKS